MQFSKVVNVIRLRNYQFQLPKPNYIIKYLRITETTTYFDQLYLIVTGNIPPYIIYTYSLANKDLRIRIFCDVFVHRQQKGKEASGSTRGFEIRGVTVCYNTFMI